MDTTSTLDDDALLQHEQSIIEALRAIRAQKLWSETAESFKDYLDGLFERMKSWEK